MLPPAANEIAELVRRLGSRNRSAIDAAMARLAVLGPRAAEHLIEALEGENDRIRDRSMQLLALIQDPRGREPLVAMLLDRNPRMRETAARSLGRFPAPHTVAALSRALARDRAMRVRLAAVQALVDQCAAGQDTAVARVLELLTNTDEPTRLRLAASQLLPLLSVPERVAMQQRLVGDPDDELRRAARRVDEAPDPRPDGGLHRWIASLGAQDYNEWNRAVRRLATYGDRALEPLLDEMRSRAHDPELCSRAGIALKAMGPRRARAIADALERVEDPLPLGVLVEVLGALGVKAPIYRLKDLIERLERKAQDTAGADGFDLLHRVWAKAHLELARIGSRVAADSLRRSLADPDSRVELELLSAAELIGKREELGPLLRAWGREDEFVRERIGRAIRAIMKRERIRRNSSVFRTLDPDQRAALEVILPPAATRSRRRASVPRRQTTESF